MGRLVRLLACPFATILAGSPRPLVSHEVWCSELKLERTATYWAVRLTLIHTFDLEDEPLA